MTCKRSCRCAAHCMQAARAAHSWCTAGWGGVRGRTSPRSLHALQAGNASGRRSSCFAAGACRLQERSSARGPKSPQRLLAAPGRGISCFATSSATQVIAVAEQVTQLTERLPWRPLPATHAPAMLAFNRRLVHGARRYEAYTRVRTLRTATTRACRRACGCTAAPTSSDPPRQYRAMAPCRTAQSSCLGTANCLRPRRRARARRWRCGTGAR